MQKNLVKSSYLAQKMLLFLLYIFVVQNQNKPNILISTMQWPENADFWNSLPETG